MMIAGGRGGFFQGCGLQLGEGYFSRCTRYDVTAGFHLEVCLPSSILFAISPKEMESCASNTAGVVWGTFTGLIVKALSLLTIVLDVETND